SDRGVAIVILRGNPYSGEAADAVEGIRERLHAISPGALLGGLPAENWDVEQTNGRDTRLIVPLVLLVVGLILVAVLRAIAAPLYLMLTVVLSFAGTLGLSTFLFSQFGGEGITFDLTLLSFLFLVALGVDYNIFLMTRVREEALQHGTRRGALTGLAATGGVITSAGLVLAGTFAALGSLPLVAFAEIGFAVAFGVLLDTLVVRSVLVTALNLDLDRWMWWPSKLFRPHVEPPAEAERDLQEVS
ncbi:MAG: MMPL family transporter, partial [Actinoplanes sp.]